MLHVYKRELVQAQTALIAAILLQVLVWRMNHHLFGPQYFIILAEIALVFILTLFAGVKTLHERSIYRIVAFVLLGLMSAANFGALIVVLGFLVAGSADLTGLELLSSAVAIFLTNIIVFGLWYWEIDSPGLTRKRWSKHDRDFQFTQQENPSEYADWKPEFFDYLYLSITNAINFASADAKPLTRSVKLLMSVQALISVFTLALVIARSVSILGS